jgi:hypothetical protein
MSSDAIEYSLPPPGLNGHMFSNLGGGGGIYSSAGNLYGNASRMGFPLGFTSAPISPMGSQGSGLNQSQESFWPPPMHPGNGKL